MQMLNLMVSPYDWAWHGHGVLLGMDSASGRQSNCTMEQERQKFTRIQEGYLLGLMGLVAENQCKDGCGGHLEASRKNSDMKTFTSHSEKNQASSSVSGSFRFFPCLVRIPCVGMLGVLSFFFTRRIPRRPQGSCSRCWLDVSAIVVVVGIL